MTDVASDLTDAELREFARGVLTDRQWEVWERADRLMSQQAIALVLDISRGTVRDHLAAATRNLNAALKARATDTGIDSGRVRDD